MTGNKSKVTYAFALSILAVIAMVSASYAWLGISRIPSVTDMSLSVITDNALLIAPDQEGTPGQWDNYLDLSAVFENMEPLKPVTYSSAEDSFYGVEYGTDGRPSGTSPDTAGQMITYEFWMKSSGSTAAIRLASPTLTPDGKKGAGTYVVGEPVWNGETISHDNGGTEPRPPSEWDFAASLQTAAERKTAKAVSISMNPTRTSTWMEAKDTGTPRAWTEVRRWWMKNT